MMEFMLWVIFTKVVSKVVKICDYFIDDYYWWLLMIIDDDLLLLMIIVDYWWLILMIVRKNCNKTNFSRVYIRLLCQF